MFRYEKISHFQYQNQSRRVRVNFLGNFLLVYFLFVINEVFSVFVYDLQKHNKNRDRFLKELLTDAFLQLNQIFAEHFGNRYVLAFLLFRRNHVLYYWQQSRLRLLEFEKNIFPFLFIQRLLQLQGFD